MVDVSCLGVTRSFALTASFFFFNDTATTEIYTLSLHDALPIYRTGWADTAPKVRPWQTTKRSADGLWKSREVEKSKTRLSHLAWKSRKRRGIPTFPQPRLPLVV